MCIYISIYLCMHIYISISRVNPKRRRTIYSGAHPPPPVQRDVDIFLYISIPIGLYLYLYLYIFIRVDPTCPRATIPRRGLRFSTSHCCRIRYQIPPPLRYQLGPFRMAPTHDLPAQNNTAGGGGCFSARYLCGIRRLNGLILLTQKTGLMKG